MASKKNNENMEAIRVEMQHMAEAISELEKIQTESPKKSQDDITLRFHFVKESLGKITENYDSTVKKLEKTASHSVKRANDTTKIAVQASITLLKDQVERRKGDIARAANQKKQQAWLLSLCDDAIHHSSLNMVDSDRLDNCVGELYCEGSKQLNQSITRWQEEVDKAEGEIRKLEWMTHA
ncbi:hypothetical protein D6C85_06208 [Aureobasidium pullulans]|uniref:Uncharacterized protein n=1 Tax=Aureobasidium pullulans TaxID=5580 RepID=A0A4S9WXA9_AURPU|nr:hypothetical protein D6C85_06208 [Aureobasidium pullulans]